MGYSICNYLINFVGQVGLVLLLIMMVFATFIWVVNPMMQLQGVSLERFAIPGFEFVSEGVATLMPTKKTSTKTKSKSKKKEILGVEDVSDDIESPTSADGGLDLELNTEGRVAEPAPTETDASSSGMSEGTEHHGFSDC